jgi:hypothetical protein
VQFQNEKWNIKCVHEKVKPSVISKTQFKLFTICARKSQQNTSEPKRDKYQQTVAILHIKSVHEKVK